LLIGAGVLLVANGWEIFKAASVSGSDPIAKPEGSAEKSGD
jgi:hypothetical protein